MGQIGSLVSFAPNTIIRSADHNSNNNTIKTTYNTHDAATSGMHGITGSFVGTSDSQTLTNKTLTAPTITSAVLTGDTSFGTNLLYIDDTNNRIYEGAITTTTIAGTSYQHQITALSGGTNLLGLISNAASTTGVKVAAWHNSASPAAGDTIYSHSFYANNNAAAIKQYGGIICVLDDVTASSEDAYISIQVMDAGTLDSKLLVYSDQVQIEPQSLVVGTNTNIFNSQTRGLYVNRTENPYLAVFRYVDDSANGGSINLVKDSASPAVSDELATIFFSGRDSATNVQPYASIVGSIVDPTSTSEDGKLTLTAYVAGSDTTHLTISEGTTAITGLATITSTTTTSDVCTITASSLTTGSALRVYSNSSSSSTRNLVEIINDNSSSANTDCLHLQQDSNANCLTIAMANTVGNAIEVISSGVGLGLRIEIDGSLSGSDIFGINIDGTNGGTGDFVAIDFSDLGAGGSGSEFCFKTNATAGVLATSTTNSTGSFWIKDSGGTARQVPYF